MKEILELAVKAFPYAAIIIVLMAIFTKLSLLEEKMGIYHSHYLDYDRTLIECINRRDSVVIRYIEALYENNVVAQKVYVVDTLEHVETIYRYEQTTETKNRD